MTGGVDFSLTGCDKASVVTAAVTAAVAVRASFNVLSDGGATVERDLVLTGGAGMAGEDFVPSPALALALASEASSNDDDDEDGEGEDDWTGERGVSKSLFLGGGTGVFGLAPCVLSSSSASLGLFLGGGRGSFSRTCVRREGGRFGRRERGTNGGGGGQRGV